MYRNYSNLPITNNDKIKIGLLVIGVAALSAAIIIPGSSGVVLHPKTGYPNFKVRGLLRSSYYKVGEIVQTTDTLVNNAGI